MALKLSAGALRNLQKYAKYIGGKDAEGQEHQVLPRIAASHMFAVRNDEIESGHWTFVTGDRLYNYIVDDDYSIDYIGCARDFRKLDVEESELTPKQKAYRKQFLKYAELQKEDLIEGKRKQLERQGQYVEAADIDLEALNNAFA